MTAIQTLLGVLTVVGQVLLLFTIISFFISANWARKWRFFLRVNSVQLIFVVAMAALLGSLYFSDILGYEPCKFCWYQRIAMYPMAVLALVAWIKSDRPITRYTIWLSAIGALIALNHYILQRANVSILPCPAVGYSASCSEVFTMQFGYITIPLMALTAFVLIFVLSMMGRKQ